MLGVHLGPRFEKIFRLVMGMLVQLAIPAFFCNFSSLYLGFGMGLSRDHIRISHCIILQNAMGSEFLFLTRNASCASRAAF